MKCAHLLEDEDRPAPGGLRFVQGLLNTRDIDNGLDSLSDTGQALEWLERFGLISSSLDVEDDDIARLRSFREAVRELIATRSEGDAVASIAATLDDVTAAVHLGVAIGSDGSVALENRSSGIDGAIGQLLVAIHDAAANGTWQRLKVCARDSCRWVYYDASKNRSSNWCNMRTCGNREKAARHRHKAATAT